ncbi:MAG TPA: hypothetical protein ENF38_00340 [Candidatus Aenigmarchaeota archaeon]|nr:hypothetical protein [Candidatus Aenigmarchaeota archaeon]
MNLVLILAYELLAFAFISFWEAAIEGKYGGGGKNPKFYRILGFKITKYHFWLWYVSIPLFIMFPSVVAGFTWKLFGALATGAFLGGILEDFLWFVVNPYYGLRRFNSKYVQWLKWVKIGKVEVPRFYFINLLLAILFWLIFVYRSFL